MGLFNDNGFQWAEYARVNLSIFPFLSISHAHFLSFSFSFSLHLKTQTHTESQKAPVTNQAESNNFILRQTCSHAARKKPSQEFLVRGDVCVCVCVGE